MKHTLLPTELRSGAKGLLVDVPGSTVVNMEFTFLSGYDFVERSKYEVPHSMEHLIFGANKYYKTAQSFAREFGVNGAYHNAYTNSLLNGYVAEVAEFEWERVMELFWQGLTTPKFLPAEFETEQQTVVEELTSRLQDYSWTVDIALMRAMGDDHLLGYATRLEYLDNVTPADLQTHHQQTHNPHNMRFVVAGNLRGNRTQVLSLLERYTKRLPSGERKNIPDSKLIQPLGPVSLKKDVDKCFFSLKTAFYGELSEREEVSLAILSYILTGAWDSRIFGQGRTKGLLYHIVSRSSSSAGATHFTLSGSVVPTKAEAMFKFVANELAKVRASGVTADELKNAKQYMLGSFQIAHQTTQSLVNWYARYFTQDDYYDFSQRDELIKSITRRDIERITEKLFNGNYWGTGVLAKDPEPPANQLHTQAQRVWG